MIRTGVARWLCIVPVVLAGSAGVRAADETHVDVSPRAAVVFEPTPTETRVPERFRLKPHRFTSAARFIRKSGPVRVFQVTYPTPRPTEVPQNNTVHAEYYQPAGAGPFPGVVVLHILGGDFTLSQTIANSLARRRVAALFIKMPYYGPRRPAGSSRRMIDRDPDKTVAGMTQAVGDIRRGAAWLGARPEVDSKQLGVTGISLGGIMSALSASAEPRFGKVAIYLGGGKLGEALWAMNEAKAEAFRREWIAGGGTRQSFIAKLRPVDPVTWAGRIVDRRVLMVNATDDEIIPRDATMALWNSIEPRPKLVWLKAGHYTAARYLLGEIDRLSAFFQPDDSQPAKPR